MSFYPHTERDRAEMLKRVGVNHFDELICCVPEELKLKEPLKLPPSSSEIEILSGLKALAARNRSQEDYVSFLGSGYYDHYIPSVINHILLRSEFYTAYTPYQAEVSQGTLQVIYEFQSLIAELYGMEVANASMYDGASSLAEAALLAHQETGRKEILIFENVHPRYRRVLLTYVSGLGLKVKVLRAKQGLCDITDLEQNLSERTACVIAQNPNFFGLIEELEKIEKIIHSKGALFIVSADPISLGLIKPPGEYGADIAVGEGQGLGIPASLGGPALGLFCSKRNLIRRMPGRIAALTTDNRNQRGFVLTLQTREQHIRREKATSNICTNQGLMALAATVYLSLMGKQGVSEVANQSLQKAHYTFEEITRIPGFLPKFSSRFFKEFVIQTPVLPKKIISKLLKEKIFAGIEMGKFYKEYNSCLLVCVTEKRTKAEIDNFVALLKQFSKT